MAVHGTGRDDRRRLGPPFVAIVLIVAAFAGAPATSLDPASAATVTAPGPIALGDSVTGVAVPGTADTYSLFIAASGATVVLGVTDNECGCRVTLTGPNGTLVDGPLADVGPRWVPGGAYTIVVTATTAGSYAFALRPVPDPQSFAITVGAVVSDGVPGAGAGRIEVPGARDTYTFSVPAGGTSALMNVLASSCGCEWTLRVVNGPVIVDARPLNDARIGLAAGAYSLRVSGVGANTGPYSFALRAAPAVDAFDVAVGDAIADGTPAPGAGNLESAGARDVYRFDESGGSRIGIVGSDCAVTAAYTLAAPSGRLLTSGAVCGASPVVVELPDETGTYELRVGAPGSDTGTYALHLVAATDDPTVAVPAADVFALAPGTVVADGAPGTGAGRIETAGAHDVYVLDGVAGATVVVDDTSTGGCSGLVWSGYEPDAGALAVDVPLGCAGSRRLRLDQTGRYEIDVRGPAAATGTYSFVVRTAPAPQRFAVALGTSVSHSVPAAGAGTIESAGAVDIFTFTATRGSSVAVTDATAGGCVPIDAIIVAPDGTPSDPRQLGCGGSTTTAVDRTGTFAVIVAGRAAAVGDYALRIKGSPAAPTALAVAAREGAVKITWKPPVVTGGSPITNAQIAVFNASSGKPAGVAGATTRPVGSSIASFTFTGLTNGATYRFVVRERNAVGLGVPSAVSGVIAPAANSRPNILFVLTDDQRFDAVAQTPKLDALPGWLRFANSFVNEPMCCPSRSTIFTGRYSHHTNVQNLQQGHNLDDRTTIATMLHAAGYHTGFLGKYLNGYPFEPGHVVPPGWDDFEAYEYATDYYNYTVNRNGTPVRYGSSLADYSTDVWTKRAGAFLRSADAARPFFLEVAYNAPHFSTSGAPVPASRDVGSCDNETFPLPVSFNAHDQISEPAWLASQPSANPIAAVAQRRKTCETLRAVDDGVSSLIDLLASIGRLSNTYVVYMSDNGYDFGEHSLTGKGDLFEESIRVPLMVRGPGVVPGTSTRLTSNVDLVPTFLAWAKTTAPAGFVDGVSWAANARGATTGATAPAEVLLRGCRSSIQQTNPVCGGYYGLPMGMNWGLRTASYKYIEYPSGYIQLFDLVHDPYELRNVAGDPARASVVANLHNRLVARRGS